MEARRSAQESRPTGMQFFFRNHRCLATADLSSGESGSLNKSIARVEKGSMVPREMAPAHQVEVHPLNEGNLAAFRR